ncbi:MAG: TetR family transcriptional regulator [Allobranchiibius sp.]
MSSIGDEGDLTARASIRNAALRLFAEHGHDAVTVREIASAAGVSPGLVIHHFGSKDGLRAAVDAHAAASFDAVFAEFGEGADLAVMLAGAQAPTSVAEAFSRAFPHGSPMPGYLRRLLLTNDPAGAALFGRWYGATRRLWDALVELGAAAPSEDPAVRAAFLLANDLALILLRNQIAAAIGEDPLTPTGLHRWAKEVTSVYLQGTFVAPPKESLP